MPIFEYKCPDCGLLNEKLTLGSQEVTATMPCKRCGAEATKRDFPSSISLARSGMDNAPVDSIVGADAARRWEDIHHRQELRDKVREETGSTGLSMVGRNDFQPLSPDKKELRTSLNETIAASGGFPGAEAVPGSP
mgnify:CR=1 FL=1